MAFGKLIISQDTFFASRQQKINVPKLEDTNITGSILHSFATLTFQERYKTLEDTFYEIFINPPEGCVIYNVKGKYNDKVTEFVVHKLQEPAINGYFDSNSNSDAINLTLGHIPSNTPVTIEITCTFSASLSSPDSFTFNFPVENYLLNSHLSADILLMNPPENLPQIYVSEGSINYKDGHLILPTIQLTKNFKIIFQFPSRIQSSAFSSKIGQFNYIGLSILPKSFKSNYILKQEIYLLIDCSGSMSGDKIKSAQKALVNFLNSLPDNCYFNILRFGSTFEQMFPQSVKNNKENISRALQYASQLDANLGGTDIYSPLMSIIEDEPRKGYVRQVFALTDGMVKDPANVISICTANRHIMRVFPFGIGQDVNHAFLKELAKSTIGEAHFIKISSENAISNAVLATLKSSQVPAIVNNQLHIEGVDHFEIAPQPIPSLFANYLTHVIVKYRDDSKNDAGFVMIEGECGDSSYEETIEIVKSDGKIDFSKLFAYHNIRDMEDRLINTAEKPRARLIKENIVRLSIQSAIVSSFTGMFTVINGVEQKPEDLQRELDKFNEEQQNQQTMPQQQQMMPQQQQMMPQKQQMIPQQQQMLFGQQQMIFGQQQMMPQQQQMLFGQQQMMPQQQQMLFGQQQMMPQQQQMLFGQQQMMPQRQMQMQRQMPMQQLCQQRMTQKQCRNQQAFVQSAAPVKQAKRGWGSSQQSRPSAGQRIQKVQKQVFQQEPDSLLKDLIRRQLGDGSWSGASIVGRIVKMASKSPTVADLLAEYPSVGREMEGLSEECVVTLIVVCWLFSERKGFVSRLKNQIKKGIDYVRSNSDKEIFDEFDKNMHFVNGILWQ